MALENFTTYTEVDASGWITPGATSISVANFGRTAEAYVYKDFGVGHFGAFVHELKVTCSAAYLSNLWFVWMLANGIGDEKALKDASVLGVDLMVNISTSGEVKSFMRNTETGAGSNVYTMSFGTPYYLRIVRDIGSMGAVNTYIFSDAARTNLLETLTLAVVAGNTFRYLYGCNNYYDASASRTLSGVMENLDIGEGGVAPHMQFYRRLRA